MNILNRYYFEEKKQLQEHLGISSNTLENFFYGKIKKNTKRKSLCILNRIDVFRKYEYNNKSLERTLHIGLEDLNELFIIIKKNLKKVSK